MVALCPKPAPLLGPDDHEAWSRLDDDDFEFTDEFDEKDWCTKGHIGIVIEGSMNIEFEGRTVEYGKGDGLVIAGGDGSRHKARIAKGGRVVLFLVEDSQRV